MTIHHLPLLNASARQQIIHDLSKEVLSQSPFFTPVMGNGAKFRYEMTNCGSLGWISDRQGYRYTTIHPINGKPWAAMPHSITAIIDFLKLSGYIPNDYRAETCLINKYIKGQSLGMHQDNSEKDLSQPLISISLGSPGTFLLGGMKRSDPNEEYLLSPGDIFIMSGSDRLRFHSFKGITQGEKRINLTIRQVNP